MNQTLCLAIAGESRPEDLRLNHIQVLGTHNSYRPGMPKKWFSFLKKILGQRTKSFDYSHLPLTEQLEEMGVRQLELDIYHDPRGGRFSRPLGIRLRGDDRMYSQSQRKEMKKPGFKVLHINDIDFLSTCPTLEQCLREIKTWSDRNPTHLPVMVLLELKEEPLSFPLRLVTVKPLRFDQEALRESGWPRLSDCREKILFALDNEDRIRDLYLKGHPSLENRVIFTSGRNQDSPEAAFFKINAPLSGNFARIQNLVKKGFLVRTRADSDTVEARKGETSRREMALASGAQFISTDYPRENPSFAFFRGGALGV